MKRLVLVVSLALLFLLGGMNMAIAQDQPQPKDDTVNMDTNAIPEFYYAIEDEANGGESGKSSSTTTFIIIGAVVVVGAAGFFLLKKKK